MRAAALALVAMMLLVAASTARADEPGTDSEQFVQRGIELRRLGKNQEALDEFQRAYTIHPTPRVGVQIAFAHQALADWVDAERGIEGALGAADDPWILRYRDVLEQALTTVRAHLGTLYVETNVAQGELRLNGSPGEPVPASDRPIRVPAGTSRFQLSAPGYVAVTRTVEVAAGAQVHVVIQLEPAASVDPAGASVTPGARVANAQSPSIQDGSPEVMAGTPRDPQRTTWAYVAFAAGGVLAVTGAVAAYVYEANAAIWNDPSRCLNPNNVDTRGQPLSRGQQCGSYERTAKVAMGIEVGAFAGAIGSAAVGAYLLWWPEGWWPRGARSRRASVACAPWSTLGVQCETRF